MYLKKVDAKYCINIFVKHIVHSSQKHLGVEKICTKLFRPVDCVISSKVSCSRLFDTPYSKQCISADCINFARKI